MVLNNQTDGEVKILKSDITLSKVGVSLMPEEISKLLSKQDLRNLVEFLANQKGPTAEKGHGAP